MRIKIPKHGQRRIIRKFAILPIFTSNECRWLEWVKLEQEYSEYWDDETNGDRWINIRFINN